MAPITNYREILRYHSLGNSQRSIARDVHCSRDTVADVIRAAEAAGMTWPLGDDVTNEDIRTVLFPGKYAHASPYTVPDFQWIHKELARKGVTLTLLWEEYSERVRASGGIPYMYTQFCEKYRRWARVTKATMRISHKPGDAMQVDWAGDPLYITDPVTGERRPAYIFVAVLPCSCYTYAEVCDDMKQENWLLCHVHAYNYFGGVTRLLIPDNCKTAVTKNTRYEMILTQSYQELSEHYGTAIVPTRVRRPDDKASVEGSVRYVSTWITAALRERTFFSLAEAKTAVGERLEALNRRPFQRPRTGCRLTAYEQEEKAFMQPLPALSYEPSVWLTAAIGYDYLVCDGLNKYSVPYDLIGKKVDIRLTKHVVEVFYNQTRVALHVRLEHGQRDPVVKPEHMPEAHRRYLGCNADELTQWAKSIGPKTEETVRYFLTNGREAEQGYKACASLTRLGKRYGRKCLENACERALRLTASPTIRNISVLCKSSAVQVEADKPDSWESGGHGITRGAAYFGRYCHEVNCAVDAEPGFLGKAEDEGGLTPVKDDNEAREARSKSNAHDLSRDSTSGRAAR